MILALVHLAIVIVASFIRTIVMETRYISKVIALLISTTSMILIPLLHAHLAAMKASFIRTIVMGTLYINKVTAARLISSL